MNKRMTATLTLLLFLACLATPALGRYLDPQTGRFRTMDSYEGSQGDPLSLHKYLYAQGNPVMHVDPSGHDGSLVELSASSLAGSYIQGGIANVTANFVVRSEEHTSELQSPHVISYAIF